MRNERSDKFEITVKGESSILLPAERAILSVYVSTTKLDKQVAAKEVVEVSRKVESLIRKSGPQANSAEAKESAAVDYWSRTSLTETSRDPWDSVKQVTLPKEYTAKVEFEVQFQRFHAISGLITSLSDLPHNTTQPVKWILKEATKEAHKSGLRMEAAKDAFRKAKDYATALGYEKVIPFELEESQIYAASSSRKEGRVRTDGVERTKKNLAEAEEGWEEVAGAVFDYQVEDIKISCAVSAGFIAE